MAPVPLPAICPREAGRQVDDDQTPEARLPLVAGGRSTAGITQRDIAAAQPSPALADRAGQRWLGYIHDLRQASLVRLGWEGGCSRGRTPQNATVASRGAQLTELAQAIFHDGVSRFQAVVGQLINRLMSVPFPSPHFPPCPDRSRPSRIDSPGLDSCGGGGTTIIASDRSTNASLLGS